MNSMAPLAAWPHLDPGTAQRPTQLAPGVRLLGSRVVARPPAVPEGDRSVIRVIGTSSHYEHVSTARRAGIRIIG